MTLTTTTARTQAPQTNPIEDFGYAHADVANVTVDLSDKRLVSVDRIRLVSGAGAAVYEVSYVYGTLRDGSHVRVDLGADLLPKRGLRPALVRCAQSAGVHGKRLGMLDDQVISAV